MIRSIWAQTVDGVIGRDGKIPWRYKGDFARFKRLTFGGVVIMGRLTYERIGKPLPGRTNIVIKTQGPIVRGVITVNGANEFCPAIESSLLAAEEAAPGRDVWFIGGARIYEAAMPYVDVEEFDVTVVPENVPEGPGVVRAPPISRELFRLQESGPHPDEPALVVERWVKR
jgi:dihydrofolate reductase